MSEKKYRPAHIDFDVVPDQVIPEVIGTFEDPDQAQIFMNKTFFSTNQQLTVGRFMDNFEKNELRKRYNEILENRLPELEQEARDAVEEFNTAKVKKDNAIGMVTSYTNEAKQLAIEVKRGIVEMRLDDQFTWKIPYKGRFFYYTYIDKEIRLVKISEMTSTEKTELFSQGKVNEDVFDKGIDNAKAKAQTGDQEQLSEEPE